jgi:hypothetical protein
MIDARVVSKSPGELAMPTLHRSTTHATSPFHRCLLAAVALAFGCSNDDVTPSDGSGTGGTTTFSMAS